MARRSCYYNLNVLNYASVNHKLSRIKENIKARRKAAGYNKDELAYILSVNSITVSRWENSKDDILPTLANFIALAEVFNCTLDDLIR